MPCITERPPFGVRKTAFCRVKDNFLQHERLPFAMCWVSARCVGSCRLVERYGLAAVLALAGLVGDVQPACPVAHRVFKKQLVEVEVGGYVGIHLAPRLHARYVYVGSLAPHVLRGVCPAHYGVEPLGAESARYAYHAESPAQRLQHVQAELPEAFGLFSVGRVVSEVSYCRPREAHLLQREVFR